MKENFKILEHISELRIRAFGKTRKELFLNMMRGMFSVIAPKTDSRQPTAFDQNKFGTGQTDKRIIKIKSQDINALLIDFLNECLYFSQINHEIYQNIKFKRFTETPHQNKYGAGQAELAGVLIGEKIERFSEDIKAVTYHGVEIKKNKNGLWQVDVIFDI